MPQEALENPVFPVFVDPSMSASVGAYSSVWEHGYTEFNQPGQKLKAGNCGWAACVRQGARARSYISMNAAGLSARDGVLPTIRSAALNGALAWNAASWSTPVDLYTAGAVHADMRWPGPTGERISTASQSGPGPVEFGGEALRAWVQTCVEHGWERTIGLALVSPNESDRNLWKQFDNAFTLTVNYQYQTGTPIVTIGGVCPSDQIAADLRPTLRAVAANRDVSAGSDVRVNFNIRATDGSLNWSSEWLSSATGSFIWPLPGALSPNRTYEVKAQAVTYENGAPIWSGISLWSNVTTFRTDDGAEPTVRALSGDVTNTSRMKAGDISVSSDNQDVVGFAYGFDGDTLVTPVLDGRMCGTFADGFVSGIVPATSSSGSKIGTIPFPWWRSNVHSVKVKAIDAKGRVSEAKVLPIETSDLQTMMQVPLGAATVQNGQVATAADGSIAVQARNGTVVTIPVSIPHGVADPSLWQVRAVFGSQPGVKIAPRIASKTLTAEGPSGGSVPVIWAGPSDNLTETFQDLGMTSRSFPFELVADCGAQTSCTLNVAGVSLVSRADTPVQLIPDQAVRVGTAQFQALWAPGEKISGVALGALTTNPQMKIEGKDGSGRLVQIPVKDFTVDRGRYSFTMPTLTTANQEAVVTVSTGNTAITVVVRQGFSGAGSTRDLWYQSQGRFGWPVAQNSFERGLVVTTTDQVNMVIPAPLSVEYAKRNFGQPTKPASILNGGMYQEFQYGELHSANGISAVPLVNGLRAAFHDKGGFSDLGFATSGEWALWNGACQESFQRADLFWIPWSGTWAVRGGVRNAYLGRWGGPRGFLGLPLTDELAMPQGGIAQNYEHGSFYWSPRTDAQAVFGGIGAAYVADGGPRGTLGYPTSEEIRDGNGVFQRFEHGEIRWDGNSARIVRW